MSNDFRGASTHCVIWQVQKLPVLISVLSVRGQLGDVDLRPRSPKRKPWNFPPRYRVCFRLCWLMLY